ncbi:MAG TPA: hypothetical protein VNZ53_52170 [Steroidobacteraceae bacterium]|nr:hypothetical protein [Steroidobacteraceae bacterium]
MIGYDRNAAAEVLFPEAFDLLKRGIEVITGMDNDEQRLALLEFASERIVGA